jgi:hypothetical protein
VGIQTYLLLYRIRNSVYICLHKHCNLDNFNLSLPKFTHGFDGYLSKKKVLQYFTPNELESYSSLLTTCTLSPALATLAQNATIRNSGNLFDTDNIFFGYFAWENRDVRLYDFLVISSIRPTVLWCLHGIHLRCQDCRTGVRGGERSYILHTVHKNLQGVPKVLEAFVFEVFSKSLGAQKKHCSQIKAEILKFMWVCGKSQFEYIFTLWYPNEKIVRFSPFSTIIFLLVNFLGTFTTRNAKRPSSHCPFTSDYRRSSSSAPIKPVSRYYRRVIQIL